MFDNIRRDYLNHDRNVLHRGLWALVFYRYGEWSLHRRSRVMRWVTSKVYGLLVLPVQILSDINLERGATLGDKFRLAASGPIYIHPLTTFGDRCFVGQGVTIGGIMDGPGKGSATVGDDVVIGPRVTILGHLTIGDHARIGANSLVLGNVAPRAVMIGVPARRVKEGLGCFQPVPVSEQA